MKILQEKNSPLLNRKSLVLEMEFPKAATLPRVEVKKRIAEKLKIKPELIAIQKIKTIFGGKLLQITCNIYEDEKLLNYLEKPKKKESRNQPVKEKENAK